MRIQTAKVGDAEVPLNLNVYFELSNEANRSRIVKSLIKLVRKIKKGSILAIKRRGI
jgi:hypothetical protein